MFLAAVKDILKLAHDLALQQQHRQALLDDAAQAATLLGTLCHGIKCAHHVAVLPHCAHEIRAHLREDEGRVPHALPALARLR